MTEQYTAAEPDSAGGEGLEVQLAQELVDRARNEGVSLVGPDGLLAGVTRTVLQTALNAEMTQHLGYEKGDSASQGAGNHRNGTSPKTVRTEVGPVRRCYLVIRSPQCNRTNVTGRTHGWNAALNTLTMFYGDRITPN